MQRGVARRGDPMQVGSAVSSDDRFDFGMPSPSPPIRVDDWPLKPDIVAGQRLDATEPWTFSITVKFGRS